MSLVPWKRGKHVSVVSVEACKRVPCVCVCSLKGVKLECNPFSEYPAAGAVSEFAVDYGGPFFFSVGGFVCVCKLNSPDSRPVWPRYDV